MLVIWFGLFELEDCLCLGCLLWILYGVVRSLIVVFAVVGLVVLLHLPPLISQETVVILIKISFSLWTRMDIEVDDIFGKIMRFILLSSSI